MRRSCFQLPPEQEHAKAPAMLKHNLTVKMHLTILGCINFICFVVHAVLSYGLTRVMPFGRPQPNEGEVFSDWAERLSFLGSKVSIHLTDPLAGIFARKEIFLLSH